MFCEPAGKRARQAERTDHGQEDQLPAVLPNPRKWHRVGSCAALDRCHESGELAGTSHAEPVKTGFDAEK